MAGVSKAWPPDYTEAFAQRQKRFFALRKNPDGAKEFYRTRPHEFIDHWATTYDPRNASGALPAKLPFIMFPRQHQFVDFLLECVKAEENGLVEKARDMGATWVCCAFSVWLWLFWPGAAVGWGSRKEQLVDRIGDADSIFEKMRIIVRGLPRQFWPAGFRPDDHMTYMRLINPENDASITGEAGDNIGRGGRKLIYFKDESAHYERPEKIEAALADNTRVQIDISSVNGLGNVFHRRREAGVEWVSGPVTNGKTNVFVFDWRDHPAKDLAWYETRRKKAQADGLLHVFAQEVDRNYAAAVENVIIPSEWVKAAIDAHKRLGFDDAGGWCAGLDVADGGGDRNALALRKGVILKVTQEWGERDTGVTARRAVAACKELVPIALQYDCIGVGAGVKAETNRLMDEGLMPRSLHLVPWNAGAAVLRPDQRVEPGDPDTPINKDFYSNLKAQAWWQLRRRFERTWRAINEPGFTWKVDDLISLPSDLPQLRQIEKELSQATASQGARLRLVVDKTPEGTKSPNIADAIVMAFWPLPRPGAGLMDLYGDAAA
ncbi:TerL protein [Methylobacterium terricola]|uniref:TerL protein n=1 Tax=Methylobacterium terricola TaxID=2583531 RepID=A0A5C4LK72_9HYPH|nr:TerL protein [Methylobacterium terricola]TNC14897.1 TerL protein [Methylobacterium terricola]